MLIALGSTTIGLAPVGRGEMTRRNGTTSRSPVFMKRVASASSESRAQIENRGPSRPVESYAHICCIRVATIAHRTRVQEVEQVDEGLVGV